MMCCCLSMHVDLPNITWKIIAYTPIASGLNAVIIGIREVQVIGRAGEKAVLLHIKTEVPFTKLPPLVKRPSQYPWLLERLHARKHVCTISQAIEGGFMWIMYCWVQEVTLVFMLSMLATSPSERPTSGSSFPTLRPFVRPQHPLCFKWGMPSQYTESPNSAMHFRAIYLGNYRITAIQLPAVIDRIFGSTGSQQQAYRTQMSWM